MGERFYVMKSPLYIYILAQDTPLDHPNCIQLPHDVLEKSDEGLAVMFRTFFRQVIKFFNNGSSKK